MSTKTKSESEAAGREGGSATIRVDGISKSFGPITAVDDLAFDVRKGEVVGFLGPNGAGKSTTMRIINAFLPPTSGSITVGGLDVQKNSRQPMEFERSSRLWDPRAVSIASTRLIRASMEAEPLDAVRSGLWSWLSRLREPSIQRLLCWKTA